jgi:hypothetical protein
VVQGVGHSPGSGPPMMLSGWTRVTIRRNAMFLDGFREMHNLSSVQLRGRLQIQFLNELGEVEPGIDGGGLFKDFIEHLIKVRITWRLGGSGCCCMLAAHAVMTTSKAMGMDL